MYAATERTMEGVPAFGEILVVAPVFRTDSLLLHVAREQWEEHAWCLVHQACWRLIEVSPVAHELLILSVCLLLVLPEGGALSQTARDATEQRRGQSTLKSSRIRAVPRVVPGFVGGQF